MNNLSVLAKYIEKFNHIQARLQPNLASLSDKARQVIRDNSDTQQQYFQTATNLLKQYSPTPYLSHPLMQVIYNISEPRLKLNYQREKIFFDDGGHVSLDWALPLQLQDKKYVQYEPNPETPIYFVMHGLTGGSEMNYIKVLVDEARRNGFRSVCLNSRGICNEMTSPIPFTALDFHELQAALNLIQKRYPHAPLFLVGTSFGANYLTRYLIRNHRASVKGLVALASPFNVHDVVTRMGPVYQRFFVKRYIQQTVKKHKMMQYWQDIGLVNFDEVYKSKNLWEYHERVTVKIVKEQSVMSLFNRYSIGSEIKQLKTPSLFMNSIDDPIVSSEGIPQQLKDNPNVEFVLTKSGGHMCWYEGIIPKRWYPKPTINFINKLLKV